jgi:uncharacterized membrane protein YwzB
MDLFQLLISLVIVGLICYVLWWAITKIGLPEPFNKIAQAVIVLIVVIYLIGVLTGNVAPFRINIRS